MSKRRPTLSQLDLDDSDDFETMQSGSWNKGRGAVKPVAAFIDESIGGGDCWCGQHFGHDWPGKADGAPHPRGGVA